MRTHHDRPGAAVRRTLVSPGFLLALGVLLLNDHVLKPHLPGMLSGKLSDFAGLFIVGMLVVAIAGVRRAPLSLVAVAVLFAFWKSPLADAAIAFWSAIAPYRIGRVVDYTDLLALPMLLLAFRYGRSMKPINPRRLVLVPVIVLTAFGVMGTSYVASGLQLVVPDGPARLTVQDDHGPQPEQVLELLHVFAITHGLACVECRADSEHRIYGRGAVVMDVRRNPASGQTTVELNEYHPSRYQTVGGQSPFATVFGVSVSPAVDIAALGAALKRQFGEYPYRPAPLAADGRVQAYFAGSLWIESPAKGVPFLSRRKGADDGDIMTASAAIDEFFRTKAFERADGSVCLAEPEGFHRKVCRRYVSKTAMRSTTSAPSITVLVTGNTNIDVTRLQLEFRQPVRDPDLDMAILLNVLETELRSRLGRQVWLTLMLDEGKSAQAAPADGPR